MKKKLTKKPKPIPRFKTEDEERAFWSKHDATDYVDFATASPATFPELEPSTRSSR